MSKINKRKTKNGKTSSGCFAPDYININGHVYEKTSSIGVDVEIDLKEDVLDSIDNLIASGKYISRGDAIRDILRNEIRESQRKK